MKKKAVAAFLIALFALTCIVASSQAVCQHNSAYITYVNRRVCSMGCGFLGGGRQDVWDEVTTYRCTNGTTENYTRYNIHNGICC